MLAKQILLPILSAGFAFSLNVAALGSSEYSNQLDNPLLYPRATPLPFCNTSQISRMDVGSCDCRGQLQGCQDKDCSVCGLKATKDTKYCDGGCTDNEADCKGCGLWFHTLCDCIKNPSWCKTTSAPIQRNADPIWVLLSKPGARENLTTTTQLVPGILDTYKNPKHFDAGWVFAQSVYTPQAQALAMNSDRVRDQEQIHTHICRRNDSMYNLLYQENVKSSVNLSRLEGDHELYCLAVKNGGMVLDFASALGRFFAAHPNTCKERIGAGIMQDQRGYTWACATNSSSGPLGKFCYHYT